jgi:glycosyltransferase involved in cell wall biosynthesis
MSTNKWVIVHTNLDTAGGGERVCLEVARAIYEHLGCKPSLVLLEKPKKITGLRLIHSYRHYIDKLVWVFDSQTPVTLKLTLAQMLLRLSKSHDKIFVNTGLYSSALLGTATYVHYPFNLDLHNTFSGAKKVYGFFTIETNNVLNSAHSFSGQGPQNKVLIFNSTYTLRNTIQLAKKWRAIAPATFSIINNAKKFVIFPPVESRTIAKNVTLESNRDDVIIILSRISREKKIEYGILITKLLHQFFSSNAKLFVIGSLNDIAYYQYLKNLTKKMRLENYVKFFLDVDEEMKVKLLSKGKVLFHPMPGEHFGIAIVEAMAAGLIPVISRESGIGYLGIVDEKWLYLDLEKPFDIARTIAQALSAWSPEYAHKMRKIAMMFDSEIFRQKIAEVLRNVE